MTTNKKPNTKQSKIKSVFSHTADIWQFEIIFEHLKKSELIINNLNAKEEITQNIAEFACGLMVKCDNMYCKSGDVETSLLMSQFVDPTLYKKDDLLFDINEDEDKVYIYCIQCKNKGKRCNRCDHFAFGFCSCYRCRTRICEFCGADCDNPRCKITYCVGGDTNSFISGCAERFLPDNECPICDKEYQYCHSCEDKFESQCFECKKAAKKKKKKKKKIIKVKNNVIYNILKTKKSCKDCENNQNKNNGRVCDKCNIFICGNHCEKYGRFCRGVCETFYCNDCVKKGELKDCHRKECSEVVCNKCEYKCENCWDFLMIHGVDDDDIEQALRNGNYSDYFNDNW